MKKKVKTLLTLSLALTAPLLNPKPDETVHLKIPIAYSLKED
ncbi:periplasmic protein TonB [Helicobacter pylori NY40]|uniref:Periplasmic protein TonB n=1 Tax=Helicobacter pylori NY40 TaxID=1426844 RepID=A0A060PPB3_HELPX|nr:periplasmic protein TonB [Helicobacter pylori NY40]